MKKISRVGASNHQHHDNKLGQVHGSVLGQQCPAEQNKPVSPLNRQGKKNILNKCPQDSVEKCTL
jgi:hypothetical protein